MACAHQVKYLSTTPDERIYCSNCNTTLKGSIHDVPVGSVLHQFLKEKNNIMTAPAALHKALDGRTIQSISCFTNGRIDLVLNGDEFDDSIEVSIHTSHIDGLKITIDTSTHAELTL